jgi:hypothetical protein
MTDSLNDMLRKLANRTTIIVETKGEGTGVVGAGDVGMAAHTLAMELAALAGDNDACIAAIIRQQNRDPETHELVLYGVILNLLSRNLEPAYKLLDGTSTDQRARAVKAWQIVSGGTT